MMKTAKNCGINLTENHQNAILTVDELKLLEIYRGALTKQYADIGLVIHNGKLVSASLTEKFKF